MKVLMFLFLPLLLWAQESSWPDTLVMRNGKVYPCLVIGLDESTLRLIYRQEPSLKIPLPGIEKLLVAGKGVIFQQGSGLTADLKEVQSFIDQRWEKTKQKQAAAQKHQQLQEEAENKMAELEAKQGVAAEQPVQEAVETPQPVAKVPQTYSSSLGVLYTPFTSERIYEIHYPYYGPIYLEDRAIWYPYPYPYAVVSVTSSQEPQMEAQLAFRHPDYPNFYVTCDFSFSRNYSRERQEEHNRYIDGTNPSDYGDIETHDLKIFRFSIGIKYYFITLRVHKVSPYLMAGGGKQIAFVTVKTEDLYPPDVTAMVDDNEEDYLEDLNSPAHIYLGLGAEYPFNESLSLFASVRFYYTWASGKYDYRYITDTYTNTKSNDSDTADLVKSVGLGLNFYF